MNIEINHQKSQIAVAMKAAQVSMDAIAEAMNAGYAKLQAYIAEQNKQIAGAPYCCYTNANEDFSRFDMEFGIPVNEAVTESGEIFMSRTYEGKAVTGTHKGAYTALEATYTALMDYVKENSLELTGAYYDYYISNPADTPESELLTQVVFPIKPDVK